MLNSWIFYFQQDIVDNGIIESPSVCVVRNRLVGASLVATKDFTKGQPVVMYSGALISSRECNEREEAYGDDQPPSALKVQY